MDKSNRYARQAPVGHIRPGFVLYALGKFARAADNLLFFEIIAQGTSLNDNQRRDLNSALYQALKANPEFSVMDPQERDFSIRMDAGMWPRDCTDTRCRLTLAEMLKDAQLMLEVTLGQDDPSGCTMQFRLTEIRSADVKNEWQQAATCRMSALKSHLREGAQQIWPVQIREEFPANNNPNLESQNALGDFNSTVGKGRSMAMEGKKPRRSIKTSIGKPVARYDGALDSEAIREVATKNKKSVQYCYEKSLTQYPHLRGKVMVEFKVGADGSVSSAKILDSSLDHEDTEKCIIGRVSRWEFPAPEDPPVVINYPFVFVKSP